jgi:hypothetical protein
MKCDMLSGDFYTFSFRRKSFLFIMTLVEGIKKSLPFIEGTDENSQMSIS